MKRELVEQPDSFAAEGIEDLSTQQDIVGSLAGLLGFFSNPPIAATEIGLLPSI